MAGVFPSLTKTWHNETYPAIDPTQPHLSLAGKTVVITGAGRGIGNAAAHAFAAAGSSVLGLTGRNQSTLDNVKASIAKSHPNTKVLTFAVDVRDANGMISAFEAVKEASVDKQGIDILVHNAGYFGDAAYIGAKNLDGNDYWSTFEINIRGALNATRAFLANLRAKSESNPTGPLLIGVTTAAICFFPPMPSFSAYGTSKVAEAHFFQSVAGEYPDVRVLNVHPGSVETDMGKKAADAGIKLPQDDVNLSAHFFVWLASKDAEFLKSKMLWCNWDVEELKSKKDKIVADPAYLNLGMNGFPYQSD